MIKGVKFYPKNGGKFHLGNYEGVLKTTFSSDQLFSSIINNLALLYEEKIIVDTIKNFDQDLIKISSMFIGFDFIDIRDNTVKKSLCFFPKPQGSIQQEKRSEEELKKQKQAKKIHYISLDTYKELTKTWDQEEEKFYYNILDLISIAKNFGCTHQDLKELNVKEEDKAALNNLSLIKTTSKPKVFINRMTSYGENFYYQDEMIIKQVKIKNYIVKPFMYFYYCGEMTKPLIAALHLTVDEGIGGKRSQGMGSFEAIKFFEEKEINLTQKTEQFMNIGTYYPLEEEVNHITYCQLEKRSGYMYRLGGQPYRKKSVRIIKEGAVINKKVTGRILNVTPEIIEQKSLKAYLYGKAFLIPMGV